MRGHIIVICAALAAAGCTPPEHVEDASGVDLERDVSSARTTVEELSKDNVLAMAAPALERADTHLAAADRQLQDGDTDSAALHLEAARSEIALVRSWRTRTAAQTALTDVQRRYEQTQRSLESLEGGAAASTQGSGR